MLTKTRIRRSDSLLLALDDKPVLIVTHDNPDPDAIASGWALLVLLREKHNQAARVIGRGAIVRAENLHMMRLLRPPLELVDKLPVDDSAIVLVDCAPTASNHPTFEGASQLVAVIDHHEQNGESSRAPHSDIRPRAAATSTIVAGYLREQGIEPDAALATALLYAIRTEISGPDAQLARNERSVVAWLCGLADHGKLAEIEAAPLSQSYFADLLLALESVLVYEDVAVCFLPQASGPEIVGEVADLLVRCDGIHKVLCGAVIANDLVVSARTSTEGGNVLPLLRATLSGFGTYGGHAHRAGGKILFVSADGQAKELLLGTVRECWLTACEVDRRCAVPLVPKPAMLERVVR